MHSGNCSIFACKAQNLYFIAPTIYYRIIGCSYFYSARKHRSSVSSTFNIQAGCRLIPSLRMISQWMLSARSSRCSEIPIVQIPQTQYTNPLFAGSQRQPMSAVLGERQLFRPGICGQISGLRLQYPGLSSLHVGLEMPPSALSPNQHITQGSTNAQKHCSVKICNVFG